MPALLSDGFSACGRESVSAIQFDLPAGDYVFASPQQPDGEMSVVTSLGTAVTCGGVLAEVSVLDPVAVAIGVRSNATAGTPSSVLIRNQADLCPISDMGCCEASGLQASEACLDLGLHDCVVDADPFCADNWDPLCVARGTLFCGAACL